LKAGSSERWKLPLRGWGIGQGSPSYSLFIVDGSIFVTAAGVNPTNTIQALALHVANTMKKNLATLFD
jgi:hypothetical protein